MTTPTLSVVLPVYNGATFLHRGIESIQNQTFSDWELIVVNDGSSDESLTIAQKFANADSRIEVVDCQPNQGLPKALNTGFSRARGRYWTWTSHDNEYLPTAFARLLEVIQGSPGTGLVYTDMIKMDEDGRDLEYSSRGGPEELIYRNCIGACFLYTRQAAEATGTYDPDLVLVEDYNYWLRLSKVAKIKYIPEAHYRFRVHESSLGQSRMAEVSLLDVRMRQEVIDARQVDDPSRYARSLYNKLARLPHRTIHIPKLWWQHPAIFLKLVVLEYVNKMLQPLVWLKKQVVGPSKK